MVQDSGSGQPQQQGGRWIGWVAIVVGVVLLLAQLSALANGNTSTTDGAGETAGLVVGRILILVVGALAITYGVRRLRR